jgi:hypothetical protein
LVDATPRLDKPARAPLAPTKQDAFGWNRHREERSDAAIQESSGALRSPGLLRFARNDELGLARQHDVPRSSPETSEGCPYAARCAFARPRCLEEAPILEAKGDQDRKVACHFPLD